MSNSKKTIKSNVKAGGLSINHNTARVKTGTKAGGGPTNGSGGMNHNAMRVKTGTKAGGRMSGSGGMNHNASRIERRVGAPHPNRSKSADKPARAV